MYRNMKIKYGYQLSGLLACLALGFLSSASAEKNVPNKIVSLGGTVTEILFAMGHDDKVVAADTTSVYPQPMVSKIPKVGYMRQLSAEGILSFAPNLILASEGAGPKTALEQIRSTGVSLEMVDIGYSVASAQGAIRKLGKLVKADSIANKLIEDMNTKLAAAEAIKKKMVQPPRVMFIYARGSRVLMVSGKDTSAHAMIELAGGVNAFAEVEGFKPLTAESVVAAKPEVILMLSRGVDSVGGDSGVLKLPGVNLTEAGKNKRVIAMDDLKLLGFGPRLGEAVFELSTALSKLPVAQAKR